MIDCHAGVSSLEYNTYMSSKINSINSVARMTRHDELLVLLLSVHIDEHGVRHNAAAAADDVITPAAAAASAAERRLHSLDSRSTDVVQSDCYGTPPGSGPLIPGGGGRCPDSCGGAVVHGGPVGAPAVETW